MLLAYNFLVNIYFVLVWLASFFNKKAALWISGRRKQLVKPTSNSIWFHFASLGEFEQGRPVLEALKAEFPGKPIVITFFSPSGYEVRKNTPLADAVYYLPLDGAANARKFIDAIKPEIAVFTKYEYWYHFFNTLHQRNIPLYIISGIFRPDQIFFTWYGGLHRKILNMVSHFFVQDEASRALLAKIGVSNTSIAGDTRFDRVWANAKAPKNILQVAEFKGDRPLFIGGSTWPKDEELIAGLLELYPDWKFVFAPHEIGEDKIQGLADRFSANELIRFSAIGEKTDLAAYRVLVIDNMGYLSSVYQYGDVAYIGGGFGVGIHNTLEAAAFGMPLIIGPNYLRFKEAKDLVAIKACISIDNYDDLRSAANLFLADERQRRSAGARSKKYVDDNKGATATVVSYIKKAIAS